MSSRKLVFLRGRRVGSIAHGVLYVTCRSSRGHILLSAPGPGLALNREVLQSAIHAGCQGIEIKDASTGRTYRASMETFLSRAIPFNKGFGEQWCLRMRWWSVTELEPAPEQLELQL